MVEETYLKLPHEAGPKPGLESGSYSPFNALFSKRHTGDSAERCQGPVHPAVSLLCFVQKWFVVAFLLMNRERLYTVDGANQGSQWDNATPQTEEFFSSLKDNN